MTMKKFDDWWHSIYADKPKMIHRQCWEEGHAAGYEEGVDSVHILKAVAVVACIVAVIVLVYFVRS